MFGGGETYAESQARRQKEAQARQTSTGAQPGGAAPGEYKSWEQGFGLGSFIKNIGSEGHKEWFTGGGATKGMLTQPMTADYQRGYLQGDFMNRGAPQMNTMQSDAARADQNRLAAMLFQQAQGQRAGAGELAVNRQANRALAAQTAQAQMARGAGAGMAARNAARNRADIGVNAAGQASIAQLQDQQSAQNQLGGLLGAQRQQDIGVAGANQAAQLQQQQQQLAALAQMLGVDKAALEQDLAKRQLSAEDKGQLGNILTGIGGAMTKSDERVKTDISDASDEVDWMLLNIDPKRYRYKEGDEGSRVGIMAQDLMRSKAGADVVEEVDGVLHVDLVKALMLALASVARLDARVRELEGR